MTRSVEPNTEETARYALPPPWLCLHDHPVDSEGVDRNAELVSTRPSYRPLTLRNMTIKITELPSDHQIEEAAAQRIQRRRETGKTLVDVARQLQDAQSRVEELTREYEDAYKEATTDAWTTTELTANGIPAPTSPVRRQRGGRRRAKAVATPTQAPTNVQENA